MERGGGDPAAGNPHRCEITTDPVPYPGWTLRLSFHAFPSADPNIIPIHVFIAGDDSRASQGEPRRSQVTRDGVGPSQCGWAKTLEFTTYQEAVEGTVKFYVSECGECACKFIRQAWNICQVSCDTCTRVGSPTGCLLLP